MSGELLRLARTGRRGYAHGSRAVKFRTPAGAPLCGERCAHAGAIDWDYAAYLLRFEAPSAALAAGATICSLLHPVL